MNDSDERLAQEAIDLAADLLRRASTIESRPQRKHRKRMARMLADEGAKLVLAARRRVAAGRCQLDASGHWRSCTAFHKPRLWNHRQV